MSITKQLKISLPLALVLVFASNIVLAQDYTKITRLGTSQSVCAGGIQTKEELQDFYAKNPSAAREILADSGWAGSADDLLDAISRGDMVERSYPVGTKLAWMGAKVNGRNIAHPYREWAGSKSFEAFQVNVSTDCNVYHIAIPKACCNISLVAVTPDDSAECSAPEAAAIDAAPAAAAVAPVAANKGASNALGLVPFIGLFGGSETRPRREIAWDMDMIDTSSLVGLRAGLAKQLNTKTSAFVQASYYERTSVGDGFDYPDDNLAIDIGVDYKLTPKTFIGGGIGAWNVDDSDFSDTSLFGHVGGDIGNSNFQWFLEGRVFDSDSDLSDSISDNNLVSGGIRYLIK